MATNGTTSLPPMAPFPIAAWRSSIESDKWTACLDDWITLTEFHLSLPLTDFKSRSSRDISLITFMQTFMAAEAQSPVISSDVNTFKFKILKKNCFLLSHRLLSLEPPSESLLSWKYLADICKVYGRKQAQKTIKIVWVRAPGNIEHLLARLKEQLILTLDLGVKGDPTALEADLRHLNSLFHASPDSAAYFMTGSDFLDGLISCYKLMNPPLRSSIIASTYLCLIGLTEGERPNFSLLTDQLYSLSAAAEAHKIGPTNANDSLVTELVTATPIIKQIVQRAEDRNIATGRLKPILGSLEMFRKAASHTRPKKLVKRAKGKSVDKKPGNATNDSVRVHQLSKISSIQDLFPDLGSGFILKLLDEYNDDIEQITAHLLDQSLPPHLKAADHGQEMEPFRVDDHSSVLEPRTTPPLPTTRHNIFDNDELDQLTVDASRLHFGQRNQNRTADDILRDREHAPNKAAIFSALATFDSDDDERDDSYDVEDVGGTVDSATPGNNPDEARGAAAAATEGRDDDNSNNNNNDNNNNNNNDDDDDDDEALFRAYRTDPSAFGRDAATRRSPARTALRSETGLTDEAVEGWALMLARDPRRLRRLEARFSGFAGAQRELNPTAWRASPAGSGQEDSDADNAAGRGGRGRGRAVGMGRGRGQGQGRGRGRGGGVRGNVAGPAGDRETEIARSRKEAGKGSRANHNRRDQRAKKMARGGFPG